MPDPTDAEIASAVRRAAARSGQHPLDYLRRHAAEVSTCAPPIAVAAAPAAIPYAFEVWERHVLEESAGELVGEWSEACHTPPEIGDVIHRYSTGISYVVQRRTHAGGRLVVEVVAIRGES